VLRVCSNVRGAESRFLGGGPSWEDVVYASVYLPSGAPSDAQGIARIPCWAAARLAAEKPRFRIPSDEIHRIKRSIWIEALEAEILETTVGDRRNQLAY
jgi:hypothetical protein